MIHHVWVGTNDVGRSKRFYDAVLPIVGIVPMTEDEGGLGYGSGTFHFSVQVPIDGRPATVAMALISRLPSRTVRWSIDFTRQH